MKIALGTAQFGMDYGVSNSAGQVKVEEAREILEIAKSHKINTIDTAITYGNSESVLGDIGVDSFKVISKLPPFPSDVNSTSVWINDQVKSSLERTKLNSLFGLLLHKSSDLYAQQGIEVLAILSELKDKGLVNKVGVSIYSPEELDALGANINRLDIVQAPFNVFDRRLESSGWLKKLSMLGVEVHTRSVFLQGLLLLTKEQRNPFFSQWDSHFKSFDNWIANIGQTPLEACLKFVDSCDYINKVIVGVQSTHQLSQILSAVKKNDLLQVQNSLEVDDEMLINPSNWNLGGNDGH
jgi:hypothetical protein